MKRIGIGTLVLSLLVAGSALLTDLAVAAEGKEKAVTISGVSNCAQCTTAIKGHDLMLNLENGLRVVIKGKDASIKAAHKVRKSEKTMTATLVGPILVKKDGDGKPYLEATASKVAIKS